MRTMFEIESEIVSLQTLVTHERQARDRGWWSTLAECYTPEATIQTSWFTGTASEYIELSKTAFEQVPSNHRLGTPVVDVHAHRAIIEMPMTIEMRGTFRGIEVDVTSNLRFLHRAEKRDDRWQLAASVAIFDHDTMTPALPGIAPQLTVDDIANARPSYRILTLWMTERGYTVPDNRLGVDRPAELEELYDRAYAWAGIERQ